MDDDLSVEVKELAVLSKEYPKVPPHEYIRDHGGPSLLKYYKKKQEHNPHIEKFGVENLVDRSLRKTFRKYRDSLIMANTKRDNRSTRRRLATGEAPSSPSREQGEKEEEGTAAHGAAKPEEPAPEDTPVVVGKKEAVVSPDSSNGTANQAPGRKRLRDDDADEGDSNSEGTAMQTESHQRMREDDADEGDSSIQGDMEMKEPVEGNVDSESRTPQQSAPLIDPPTDMNVDQEEEEEEDLPPELKELAFYVARNVRRDDRQKLKIVYAALKRDVTSAGSQELRRLWENKYNKNYLDLVPKSKLPAFRVHRTLLLQQQDDDGKAAPRHNLMVASVPTSASVPASVSASTSLAEIGRKLSPISSELAEIYVEHMRETSSRLANWDSIKDKIFDAGSKQLQVAWTYAEKHKTYFVSDKMIAIVPPCEIKSYRAYRDELLRSSPPATELVSKPPARKKAKSAAPKARVEITTEKDLFRDLSPMTRELSEFTAKSIIQSGKNHADWHIVEKMIRETGTPTLVTLWNDSKTEARKRAHSIVPWPEREGYRAYRDYLVGISGGRNEIPGEPESEGVARLPSTVTSTVLTARTLSALSPTTKELAELCGRHAHTTNLHTQWDKVEMAILKRGSEQLKEIWQRTSPNQKPKAKKYRLLVPATEMVAFHALRKELAQKYHPRRLPEDEGVKRINALREERKRATVAANEIRSRAQLQPETSATESATHHRVFGSFAGESLDGGGEYQRDIRRFFKWRFKRLGTISDESIEDWKESIERRQGSGLREVRRRFEEHFNGELAKLVSLRDVYCSKFGGNEAQLVDAFFSRLVASWTHLFHDIVGLWESYGRNDDVDSFELKQRSCWQYFEAADKAWVSLHLNSLD